MNNNICFTKIPEIVEDDNPPISKELSKKIQKSGCNSLYEYTMKQISEMCKEKGKSKNNVIIIDYPTLVKQ